MTGFSQRSLTGTETLGDRLRNAREQAGISIASVAADLRIRPDYIAALEQSNYTVLPGSVFVKNYVRKYAKYLHLGQAITDQLLDQELRIYTPQPDIPTTQRHLSKRPLLVVQVVVIIGVIFLIAAIGSYFVYEISNIIQPPSLTIDVLPEQVPTSQHFITLSGQTAPEVNLAINDQAVPVTEDGRFSTVMTLRPGINIFKIVAKTKRSKDNIQYRQIVVQ